MSADRRFDLTTTTTCGYCGVGCRLEAHARGGRIVSISPAEDGPSNRGSGALGLLWPSGWPPACGAASSHSRKVINTTTSGLPSGE